MLPRLMVAPNGARRTRADHPALPVTLPQIVETARACAQAGADGLHLHLRNATGGHVLDAGLYAEALAELETALPGFYVQVTTEAVGLYTPAEQRALVRALRPRAVSISLAEMLSDGNLTAARALYDWAAGEGIEVQHILYGADDLALWDRVALNQPAPQMLFVLGRYSAGQQSDPAALAPFLDWLTTREIDADWAACAFGRAEIDSLLAAHAAGGKMRIGFENSMERPDGTPALDNAERVRDLIAALGPRYPRPGSNRHGLAA